MSAAPVTVIGLGPMGRGMADAFLDAGHHVTVWNRTPARAAELVAKGARLAATPAAALAAADVIVLSLTDYQAMYDILDGSPASLAGKVLVNLSSDSPDRSREAAAWAASHGAEFVTGGVMNPAPMIGSDAAYAYYSGSREAFDAVADVVRHVGAPHYVGADPGLAQLYYQAQLAVFLTTLAAVLHALALAGSAGVSAQDFLPEILRTVRDIPDLMGGDDDTARQLDAREYPGDLSTTTMMGATAEHIVAASKAAGVDLELPQAVSSLYQRAIATGHGRENWTSLMEVLTGREPGTASSAAPGRDGFRGLGGAT